MCVILFCIYPLCNGSILNESIPKVEEINFVFNIDGYSIRYTYIFCFSWYLFRLFFGKFNESNHFEKQLWRLFFFFFFVLAARIDTNNNNVIRIIDEMTIVFLFYGRCSALFGVLFFFSLLIWCNEIESQSTTLRSEDYRMCVEFSL